MKTETRADGYVYDTESGSPVVWSGLCPECSTNKVYWNGREDLGPQACIDCSKETAAE